VSASIQSRILPDGRAMIGAQVRRQPGAAAQRRCVDSDPGAACPMGAHLRKPNPAIAGTAGVGRRLNDTPPDPIALGFSHPHFRQPDDSAGAPEAKP
jgi:hypothetical protein